MKSLVVFLSVAALATAKPSGILDAGLVSYAAPSVAVVPAAVSSQSRIDIKSSPSVISTAAFAPITKTIISAPAPAIVAPAAVSSQSRIDIKSSPGLISTVAAAPIVTAPIARVIAAPTLIKSAISPSIIAPSLYESALAPGLISQAVVKTANGAPILGAPGLVKTIAPLEPVIATPALQSAIIGPAVPLDTPEVIAARAAHLEAKVLAGAHLIRKRSAPLVASAPWVSTYAASPIAPTLTRVAPISSYGLSAPILTKAYGIHPW